MVQRIAENPSLDCKIRPFLVFSTPPKSPRVNKNEFLMIFGHPYIDKRVKTQYAKLPSLSRVRKGKFLTVSQLLAPRRQWPKLRRRGFGRSSRLDLINRSTKLLCPEFPAFQKWLFSLLFAWFLLISSISFQNDLKH